MKNTIVAVFAATLLFYACEGGNGRSEKYYNTEEADDAKGGEAPGAYAEATMTDSTSYAYAEEAVETEAKNEEGYLGNQNKLSQTVKEARKPDYSTVMSSYAASINKNDSTRKFIRTADMRFRVKDVKKATYRIEEIAAKYEGFVTYTNLTTSIDNTTRIPISKDSLLESVYYSHQNDMTLRVPRQHLDSAIRAIAKYVEFLDYRIIEANDITFELIANEMAQKRQSKFNNRLSKAIDNTGKKLNDVSDAEYAMLSSDERRDMAQLDNMKKMDQVYYATIHLNFYERSTVQRELVANDKNVEAYQPSFWSQIGDSIGEGWSGLKMFIVELMKGWVVILVVLILAYFVRKKVKQWMKRPQ